MLYDVTLPGIDPPVHKCPQRRCPGTFSGLYTEKDKAAWDAVVERGDPDAVKNYLNKAARVQDVDHDPTCPLRCLPPVLIARCSNEELEAQMNKVRAIIDNC
ncbi:hypothetical protein ACI2L1_39165 [Streptomyces sp. NPDC019531]|uniref:hypothetical protein n=1 Tax=Streptomyces sp. NPDC019531 TaxID=3365062 RepID=UPI003851318A